MKSFRIQSSLARIAFKDETKIARFERLYPVSAQE
jgi:hypothetical protein